MNLEESLSSGSKAEAISMAIEVIDIELFSQILAIGIDPDTFPIDQEMTIEYFGQLPQNITSAEWLAYHAIPRLVSRRVRLVTKLEELNNAGA